MKELPGFVAGLISATQDLLAQKCPEESDSNTNTFPIIPGLSWRPQQTELLSLMRDAIDNGKILLAEAATGAGKGLCIATTAYQVVRANSDARVVVSAPTFAILGQLVTEYRKLSACGEIPPYAVVLGRSEFVSSRWLEVLLSDNMIPDVEFARRWFAGEGRRANMFEADWLAADLQKVAPEFPVHEVLLREDDPDDHGFQSYRKHMNASFGARVLFATHAMLAYDILQRIRSTKEYGLSPALLKEQQEQDRLRSKNKQARPAYCHDNPVRIAAEDESSGILPRYQFALIDEAHQLEGAFSNALTGELSLFSLQHAVRDLLEVLPGLSPDAAKTVSQAYRALVAFGDDARQETIHLGRASGATDQVKRAAREMARLRNAAEKLLNAAAVRLKNKPNRKAKSLCNGISAQKAILAGAMKQGARNMVMLRFTPVRSYPRITVGPRSVERQLHYLWARLKAACAVSATLYLPRGRKGEISAHYISTVLAIPHDRMETMPPIAPEWVYNQATVHVVGDHRSGIRRWLQPLSQIDRKSMKKSDIERYHTKWHEEVAQYIERVSHDAAGGTLVLLQSYEDVNGINAALFHQHQAIKPRLIAASRDVYFSRQRSRYVEMVRAGARPIWLATGPAWVGLDLTDDIVPASEDRLLTDLVMPRLPFGGNSSPTQQSRIERDEVWSRAVVIYEAAIRFRQGIGRLVRREGVRNRRLHILDARLHDPRMRGFTRIIEAILQKYQRHEEIAPWTDNAGQHAAVP